MIKSRGVLQVLSVFLLFCYTVSYHSGNSSLSKKIIFVSGADDHNKDCYIASTHLFSNSAKTENLRVQFNNIYPFWYDTSSLLVSYRIAELTLYNKLSDYLVFSKRIVIRLQRTSIIFPFHY